MVEIEEIDEKQEESGGGAKEAKGGEKEKVKATVAEAPPAPEMPQISMSQMVPMVMMFALNKFDIEKEGYSRHVEVLYVLVQILTICVVMYTKTKIDKMEDGAKIDIPAVKQFGQEVKPATKQTAKEYDRDKWSEQRNQTIMGACVVGGIYCKWAYVLPLALQIVMTPMQMWESPLFQIHILGRTRERPFPTPNPLGFDMPKWPEEPAAAAVEAKEQPAVGDSKKKKKTGAAKEE